MNYNRTGEGSEASSRDTEYHAKREMVAATSSTVSAGRRVAMSTIY